MSAEPEISPRNPALAARPAFPYPASVRQRTILPLGRTVRMAALAMLLGALSAIPGYCQTQEQEPTPVLEEQSRQRITVYTFNRPPYYTLSPQGKPSGFLLLRADSVLRKAGLEPEYVELPPGRVLSDMAASPTPACAVGWLKTPEREKIGKFSSPIYQDLPPLAVFRRGGNLPPTSATTLEEVTKIPGMVFGINQTFSYGPQVDALLGSLATPPMQISGSQIHLMRMLGAGRFDAMLINSEELDELRREAGLTSQQLVPRLLSDLPSGNVRYLIFSKTTPADVIHRVNEAIAHLALVE